MHSYTRTRTHTHSFGLTWSPTNTALTILITLLFLIFLLLFMTLTAPPAFAQAQNSVPATAREAAAMPQFAAKLARAARSTAPVNASRVPKPAKLERRDRPAPPACSQAPVQPHWLPDDDGVLYSNGPINGNTDGWTINFGFAVSDTFTTDGSQITGLQFGVWLFPGDVLQSAEVLIGTREYGNDLFDQTVNFTQSTNCPINTFGYAICTETATFTANIAAGTPWVTLQNAVVNTGDPLYWDENSGPSLASENSVGTIPSEAFTLEGQCTGYGCQPPPPCFHADSPMQILHDFTPSEGGSSGITVDGRGNLYGTTPGGDYGAGMIYRLAQRGQDWMFTPLYSFTGGANGSGPSVLVGPEGALYGSASGGIQHCGQAGTDYCGLIFRLRPSPVACTTALCGWREDVLYQFSGQQDGGYPGVLGVDQSGNIYGLIVLPGGNLGIFELTLSNGTWTETVIYAFDPGTYLSSLLLGNDGNFYGTTPYTDTVFQVAPAGGGWIMNILHQFSGGDGFYPWGLSKDSSGNLYGVSYYTIDCAYGYPLVWELSPSGNGWVFTLLYGVDWGRDHTDMLSFTTDPEGHAAFTITHYGYWEYYDWGAVEGGTWWRTDGWFDPGGLAVDSRYIYGTTQSCGGENGRGILWSVPR